MAELWLLISAPPICPRSNSSVSPAHSPLKMCDLDSIPLAEHYWSAAHREAQFRNPKVETRKKAEIRSPNAQPSEHGKNYSIQARFGFRISGFFRPSGFGLRISARSALRCDTNRLPGR